MQAKTGNTHTRCMFGSLPTTGIRGKAARHKQPRNQLTERNCTKRIWLQVEEVKKVQMVTLMSIRYTTTLYGKMI